MINTKVEETIARHEEESNALSKEIVMLTETLKQKTERFLVVNNIISTFDFVKNELTEKTTE